MELDSRKLPYNMEAEQSVLGSVLIDPECMSKVVGTLSSKDFYFKKNREIYEAVLHIFNTSSEFDPIILLDEIEKRGLSDEVGGMAYITQLMEITPTSANLERYISIVKDRALLRNLIDASSEITQMAYEAADDADRIADAAQQKLEEVSGTRTSSDLVHIRELLLQAMVDLQSDKKRNDRAKTGYTYLDYLTNGFGNSDLVLIAARPAVGKTSFALNIAAQYAKKSPDKSVALFSLEMSKEQLALRILSSEAMVDSQHIMKGELTSEDWNLIDETSETLAQCNIYFDDNSTSSVLDIKSKCRRIKNLGMVIIDYLQLMQSGKRIENRTQEVSEITRSLKIMAKELNVPVVALSQLSRDVEKRSKDERKPRLSDLRESGSIEQDADIVLMLHRDIPKSEDEEENTDENAGSSCIVAKNRHGPTGEVELMFLKPYTKYISVDKSR